MTSPNLTRAAKQNRFIPYCQHLIGEEEIQEMIDTLRSNWLTTGPKSVQFEKDFAEYVGSSYAIAVNSCTAGLHLALRVSDIQPGDEVITTPLTFCATAEAIEYLQARPVFVDVDPVSFNIDPKLIEEKISPRTKAILPVHYGGIACDMDLIHSIASKHDLVVIEDAAHAVGTEYKNRKIGSNGNLAVFSFYPTKNMTTGEGGVVTTNDVKIADKLRLLSLHGMSKDAWKRYSEQGQWYYEIHELGYKYNFTDLQAALGLHQLRKLDNFNDRRAKYAEFYFRELGKIKGIELPEWYSRYFNSLRQKGYYNPWHLFVVMIRADDLSIDRNNVIKELNTRGVGTSVHFIPLHLQPYYAKKYGLQRGDYPVAEHIYDRIISLPLYPKLTMEEMTYIVASLKEIVCEFRFAA